MATSEAAPGQGQKAESKRDRKRQIVLDKLAQLEEEFAKDNTAIYRDQLQKISLEVGLVQRFDPYAPDCLSKISQMRKEHAQACAATAPLADGRTILDMTGPAFSNYLEAVEDATERRDFALVEHKREHDAKIARYQHDHDHKLQTAIGEHDYLSNTIRDRLMNQITSRKNRLNKEKEALEISEASALLLHPNQFSITNPASPGGTHGKRTTRTRRDAEEISGYADKKRKRNADDDGSPVPAMRTLDANHTTMLWQNDKIRMQAKQNGGALLSIDKLFTEKELSLAHNASAVSSHQSMLKSRLSPSNADSTPEESDSGQDGQENGDSTKNADSAPMERHVTRSTRSIFDEKNMGPEAMANFEVPASLKQIYLSEPPKLPPHMSQPYMKPYPRTNDPMTTTSLPPDEISADLATFSFFKWYNSNAKPSDSLDNIRGLRDTLEVATIPVSEARYRLSNQDAPISSTRSTLSKNPVLTNGGGVTPSRQSSVGTPMSRQDSNTRARGKGR